MPTAEQLMSQELFQVKYPHEMFRFQHDTSGLVLKLISVETLEVLLQLFEKYAVTFIWHYAIITL